MDRIRCPTCGKVIARDHVKYRKLLKLGYTKNEIFQLLDIQRICCKKVLITNVSVIDEQLKFDEKQLITDTLVINHKNMVNINKDELYEQYLKRIPVQGKRVYNLS
jgi:DNA-directed RNA polymerase subunit N (RpoN/RPB10)